MWLHVVGGDILIIISKQWKCTCIWRTIQRSERSWTPGKSDAENRKWSDSLSRCNGQPSSSHVEWNRTSRAAQCLQHFCRRWQSQCGARHARQPHERFGYSLDSVDRVFCHRSRGNPTNVWCLHRNRKHERCQSRQSTSTHSPYLSL